MDLLFTRRRRKHDTVTPQLLQLTKSTKGIDTSNLTMQFTNSFTNSILMDHPIESSILDENVRAKASKLLSTEVSTPNSSFLIKGRKRRHTKVSYMSLKKKSLLQSLSNTQRKLSNPSQPQTPHTTNFQTPIPSQNQLTLNLQLHLLTDTTREQASPEAQPQTQQSPYAQYQQEQVQKYNKKYYQPPDYFQLVFAKFLHDHKKQKTAILVTEMAKRYERLPDTIGPDVRDIRIIAGKLEAVLRMRDGGVELKPFQVLEVNGEFARLIFHMVHEISARKNQNYDLTKIYKQMQYCSRILQLHTFTLRICFELGQLYKQMNDEYKSHAYFVKALKLSIFLKDKFHEEKAIDCFGLTSYRSNKSGQAYYFHNNSHKLCEMQREHIQEKYSNMEELMKICGEKSYYQGLEELNGFHRRKESFRFDGKQKNQDFQMTNKKKFKENINKYISNPKMRDKIRIARSHMSKIQNIGKIKKHTHIDLPHKGIKFNENDNTAEIYLTHRSQNRKNPEKETRMVEKERRCLLELIRYYTNEIVSPS